MAEAKMVSLKMTAKEAKGDLGYPVSAQSSGKMDLPKYPYDTKLRLGTDTLEKLGISPADYKVGETFEIRAKVEVCATEMSERQSGERNCLELQVTDVAFDTAAKKKAKVKDSHLNDIASPTYQPEEDTD
jgi:hypothetical protein